MAALSSAAEIPPGGEGVIKATISTRGRSGTLNKTVTVETSDPDNRMVRLKLVAKVLVEAGLEPRAISIGRVGKDEVVTKVATLVARDPSKVKLTGVEVVGDDPNVTAKITKNNDRDAVEVTYKATKVGAVRATLKVSTTSEKHPTLDLPLHGFVLGNWELMPRTVSFPSPEEDQDQTGSKRVVRVKSRTKSAYRITKAVDPEGGVKTKLTKTDDGYEIELILKQVPEKRRGVVEITTNDPDERTLEARYFVRRARTGHRGAPPRPLKALRRELPPRPIKR